MNIIGGRLCVGFGLVMVLLVVLIVVGLIRLLQPKSEIWHNCSAVAAKEVKILIADSVGKVDAGSKQATVAGTTMNEIVASVQRVTYIMGEITAPPRSRAPALNGLTKPCQMDEVTQQNAALAERAAAAAESLQGQVGNLAQVVGVFKLDGARTVETADMAPDFGPSRLGVMQLVGTAAPEATITAPAAKIRIYANVE
jgi:hypothetical protein